MKKGEAVHAFKMCSFERNCSEQQFDISLNGVFQPLKILSVAPNRLPPNDIPQPPNKIIFRAPRESFCSGISFKTQYASVVGCENGNSATIPASTVAKAILKTLQLARFFFVSSHPGFGQACYLWIMNFSSVSQF